MSIIIIITPPPKKNGDVAIPEEDSFDFEVLRKIINDAEADKSKVTIVDA